MKSLFTHIHVVIFLKLTFLFTFAFSDVHCEETRSDGQLCQLWWVKVVHSCFPFIDNLLLLKVVFLANTSASAHLVFDYPTFLTNQSIAITWAGIVYCHCWLYCVVESNQTHLHVQNTMFYLNGTCFMQCMYLKQVFIWFF